MMNISLLASNIKLEHFIELSSSEFPQLVLANFAFPSIFEFSLFRPGLDIGGIIILKKLFRRILN